MTIVEYKEKISREEFEEYPTMITGDEKSLGEIVDYHKADIELKIHLTKVILCRCFPPASGIYFADDSNWFLNNFLREYKTHIPTPWLTRIIKEAVEMILKDEFTGLIGTTFMFGIIEFYAKYKLGFRPNDYDFFDKRKKEYFKRLFKNKKSAPGELSIGSAFKHLQEKPLAIAKFLNDVDAYHLSRSIQLNIPEERWVKVKIQDRLTLERNPMLHGEQHSFYSTGKYLTVLYILFHLHELKDSGNV